MSRLPKADHETILCGLLGQPDSMDVMIDAANALQERLVKHFNWYPNLMIHGMLCDILWSVYQAGERRGIAREENPASALFPVAEPETPAKP